MTREHSSASGSLTARGSGQDAAGFHPISTPEAHPPEGPRRHGPSVQAILFGVLAGLMVGGLFGHSLWVATGGPARRLVQREAELQHLVTLLESSPPANPSDVARLQSHRHQLEREIATLRAVNAEGLGWWAPYLRLAGQLIQLCGQVYMRLLMLVVLPLVLTSITSGAAALGRTAQLGRVAVGAFTYYLLTSAMAVILGIVLVQAIRPGSAHAPPPSLSQAPLISERPSLEETLVEVIRGRADRPGSGLVPGNIFAAAAEMNVLGIIFFALLAGLTLATMGAKAAPLLELVEQINLLMIRMVQAVLWLAPIGLFGLVAWHIIAQGGGQAALQELGKLGGFALAVLGGLAIHFVLLTATCWCIGGCRPGRFVGGVAPALATAFGTSSSSATLPVSLECSERLGFPGPMARFVLPLGATVNMDGTALYEAVAAIFLAQLAGIELGPAEMVVVFFTASLAAIGAPGIPNAGLVTLLLVLAAVNVPAEGVGLLLAIDWFLDRCRTVVNVFGDLVGVAVLQRLLPTSPTRAV